MKKYLKYLLFIGIITVTMTPARVFPFDNLSSSRQPTGFRDVYWRASTYDHPYMFTMYDNVDGIGKYNRELDILTLGKARLSEITYHFYQDKFYQVSIALKSDIDHQPLLDALVEAFGTPEELSGIYIWENDTVAIRLFPEGASISYLPILDEIARKTRS